MNTKPEDNKVSRDTKIADCVCEHAYQDAAYGKGKRVHNPTKDGWKCTVCARKHSS